MKILFTGASSFTGMWFVQELTRRGHEVTAIYRRDLKSYTEGRKKRVQKVEDLCEQVPGVSFGDDTFLDLIRGAHWDLFCHHGADVTNYKSPDFDTAGALGKNTKNLPKVLDLLTQRGCNRVLLTGSVFEANEGSGPDRHRAFSPYGLSKGFTHDAFIYHTEKRGMKLGKFVIPNPFGPNEEFRFTSFLARSWFSGETPTVTQPSYVRDNIHISLLAKCYAHFAEELTPTAGSEKINPSGYAEEQGAFTARFADGLRDRLSLPCDFVIGKQADFSEPTVRVNTDPLDPVKYDWNEADAWDGLARYYQDLHSNPNKHPVG